MGMHLVSGAVSYPVSTRNRPFGTNEMCLVVKGPEGVYLEVKQYSFHSLTNAASMLLTGRAINGEKIHVGQHLKFEGDVSNFRAVPISCEEVEDWIDSEKGELRKSPTTGYYYWILPNEIAKGAFGDRFDFAV